MKIIGATVGTTTPKPNFDQTDPRKGDYIKGDRSFMTTDDMLAVHGKPADAKATGDAINQMQTSIDTKIAEIDTSIENITNGAVVVKEAEHAESANEAAYADVATSATKDGSGNIITDTYETKADANEKLEEVKSYADGIKNDLLNGAGDAYDTLKELGDLINENHGAIEALETIATSKADANHNHDGVYYTEFEIDDMLDSMQSSIDSDIQANAEAIKTIKDDYLTSVNQTQLQDNIDKVSNKAGANEEAIGILNGDVTTEGSVKQSIDTAFSEFTTNVIDGINTRIGTVETDFSNYKNVVNDQFDTLAGTIDEIDGRIDTVEEDIASYKEDVAVQFTGIDEIINNYVAEIQEDLNGKANLEHNHDDLYYDKDEILGLITVDDIDDICESNFISGDDIDLVNVASKYWVEQYYQPKGSYLTEIDISNHNASTSAHSDIRLRIEKIAEDFYTFADCDDETLSQLQEIVNYIKNNKSLIEGITTNKVSVSDIIDNLTTNVSNKPLSAAQGVVLKNLIDALQKEIDGKIVETDDTLSKECVAADAKAVGDALAGKQPLGDYAQTSAVEALETLVASVSDQITEVLDDVSNVVKYDVAQDLTDEQKAQARANIGVDDIDLEIDEISVQLGENGAIGGYKTGDVIAAGTDIKTILNKLFQKSVPATYTTPKLTLVSNGVATSDHEYGTNITAKFKATFRQNDAGTLESISILKNGTEISTGTTSPLTSTTEEIQLTTDLSYTAYATYAEGAIKNDNLGEPSPDGHIAAGTVTSNTVSLIPYRQGYFYGVLKSTDPIVWTSDIIRSGIMKNGSYESGNLPLISASSVSDRTHIFVACPATNTGITKVIMPSSVNADCTKDFVKQSSTVIVEGANGATGIAYNLWVYSPASISDDQTFTVTLG